MCLHLGRTLSWTELHSACPLPGTAIVGSVSGLSSCVFGPALEKSAFTFQLQPFLCLKLTRVVWFQSTKPSKPREYTFLKSAVEAPALILEGNVSSPCWQGREGMECPAQLAPGRTSLQNVLCLLFALLESYKTYRSIIATFLSTNFNIFT